MLSVSESGAKGVGLTFVVLVALVAVALGAAYHFKLIKF
jgi:hypothetical protein